MEQPRPANGVSADGFADRDRRAAENFGRAAQEAGVDRIVYLGGPMPEVHVVSTKVPS